MKQSFDANRVLYPYVPLLGCFLGPVLYFLTSRALPSWSDVLVCGMAFFLFDNLGVQLGVHKHLSHRAFATAPWIRRTLAFLSVLSGQGSPLVWVAVHTGSHHPHYDTEKDIHSPRQGLWYAFLAWYWRCDTSLINFALAKEYLKDKVLVFIHRHHTWILLTYWALLWGGLGARALVFMGLLPAALSIVMAGFVNAQMHSSGVVSQLCFQKYQNHSGDTTFNSWWLGLVTMGLGLHNNHHKNPSTAYYDEKWFEVDLSRFVIPLIRRK